MRFTDRAEAGRQLAEALAGLQGGDVVVLGLLRGGIPVAFEVARAIGAPLDMIAVCKLGVPFQPELAMGAVGEDGALVLNRDVIRAIGIGGKDLAAVERRARTELERRARLFRDVRPRAELAGRTAVVVDDGVATGSTARAACQVARALGAVRVVLAVAVAPVGSVADLAGTADEVICLESPRRFHAVGQWYRDFSQISDAEVLVLLRSGSGSQAGGGASGEA